MKKLIGFLVVFGLVNLFAAGQPGPAKEESVRGGFFVAPGAAVGEGSFAGLLHFGGSVDGQIKGRLGLAASLGYLSSWEALGNGIGLFSPGLIYRFRRGEKTEPFADVGYSLFFREGTASGVFFGGGVDRWLGKRFGIRVEGRDHVLVEHNTHFLEARVAILIR